MKVIGCIVWIFLAVHLSLVCSTQQAQLFSFLISVYKKKNVLILRLYVAMREVENFTTFIGCVICEYKNIPPSRYPTLMFPSETSWRSLDDFSR